MHAPITRGLSVKRNSIRGGWLVSLEGVLDDQLDRRKLVEGLSGIVIFDMDGVQRATSFGVREWLRAMQELHAEYYGFIRCRPPIVAQFNMVAGFRGNGDLLSLYAPYICEKCSTSSNVLMDLRSQYALLCGLVLPNVPCPSCGGSAEFDDVPEYFFSHVLSRPAPRLPAVANALIDGETNPQAAILSVTMTVEKHVTALKLRGPLTAAATHKTFRRAFDGLEGYLLVDMKEVDQIDEGGVQEMLDAARAAQSPPLMLCRVDLARAPELSQWLGPSTSIVSVLTSAKCISCAEERRVHVVIPEGKLPAESAAESEKQKQISGYCTTCGDILFVRLDTRAMKLSAAPRAVSSYLRRDDVALRDRREHRAGLIAGKYERVRTLGEGGMAEVFLAKVRGLEGFKKHVVLKQIHPGLADRPELIDLFIQEARIAGKITHPNVVQILDLLISETQLIIVMEYVRGWNLAQILSALKGRGERMPPGIAARIIQDLCVGLDAAHQTVDESGRSLGIIHQDVTPHNILLSADGVVKLSDFGVAMALHAANPAQRGVVSGKVSYMAPEQLRGDDDAIGPQTDIFAVGMVLFECLFGHLPGRGSGSMDWTRLSAQEECSSSSAALLDFSDLDQLSSTLGLSQSPEAAAMGSVLAKLLTESLETVPTARLKSAAELERRLAEIAVWQGNPVTLRVLRDWLSHIMGAMSSEELTPVSRTGDSDSLPEEATVRQLS